MISAKTANKIWLWTQRKYYNRYVANSKLVAKIQQEKLSQYIQENIHCQFGKDHQFQSIKTYKDFSQQVPINDWTYFESYVEQITKGHQNILTKNPVIRFEETSGTISSSKLIPYTQSLLDEFQLAIGSWMTGSFNQFPRAFNGQSYWSISPATRQVKTTSGGLPIGVADDQSYFNPFANYLLKKILAVPPRIAKLEQDEFFLESLAYLLAIKNLTFFSAWSPTFLLVFDEYILQHKEALLNHPTLKKYASNTRIKELTVLFTTDFTWLDIWPNLSLVSCWTDAQAKIFKQQLQGRLGEVKIHGKGLLSTECVCSIPIFKDKSPALTYDAHFYEFRHVTKGSIHLAHELSLQEEYEIIVTTGGGLYRYATNDIIKVTNHQDKIPCFDFIGRKNKQSDFVGEKLSEIQVNNALIKSFKEELPNLEWIFLAPIKHQDKIGYVLNIELKNGITLVQIEDYKDKVTTFLKNNPYYKEAIQLKQLIPLALNVLPNGSKSRYDEFKRNESKAQAAAIKNQQLFTLEEYSQILNHSNQ